MPPGYRDPNGLFMHPNEQIHYWNLPPQQLWHGGGVYYRGPLGYMVQEGALGMIDPLQPRGPAGKHLLSHVDGWQTLVNNRESFRCDYCGRTTRDRQEFMNHISIPH
jgi:hypothetical protein